jgi:hypothetical protein
MGRITRTLGNWVVLTVLVIAVTGAVFVGINSLENTDWMKASQAHAALGVLCIIAALAVLNVGIMIGIGFCATRMRR